MESKRIFMYDLLDSFNRCTIYYKKPHSSFFTSKNYALIFSHIKFLS